MIHDSKHDIRFDPDAGRYFCRTCYEYCAAPAGPPPCIVIDLSGLQSQSKEEVNDSIQQAVTDNPSYTLASAIPFELVTASFASGRQVCDQLKLVFVRKS